MVPRPPHPALLVALVAATACSRKDKGPEVVVTSSTCIHCEAPVRTGSLSSPKMDESSGLAASSRDDGVFFVNNDSGDTARFFAMDRTGKLLATYDYSTDPVVDCEDIARGPCAAPEDTSSCLYVGDIGDNQTKRDHVTLYRVHEPQTIADARISSDAFTLKYPDGPHNAEAMLVHPTTGVITLVTKVKSGASGIYEAPAHLVPGTTSVFVKAGTLAIPAGSPQVTAGSVHPSGRGVLLRTYSHLYFAPMRPEQSVAQALAAPLCTLPVAREEQGEAVAWLRGGDGFVTLSEGVGSPVSVVSCAAPP